MSDNIERTLGRIESQLDLVLKQLEQGQERFKNHSERIGKLERWQARVLGAVAVAGFLLGSTIKKMLGAP